MSWFKRKMPKEVAEAYEEGRQQAKQEKLQRRIEKARKRGYEKEMRGGSFMAGLKSAGSFAGKFIDECGKFTETLEKQQRQQGRTRKKRS